MKWSRQKDKQPHLIKSKIQHKISINIMSILITGANGAIGFDLVNLISKYKKVYAISRNKIKNKKLKNVEWINHDLKK